MKGPHSPESGEYDSHDEIVDSYMASTQTSFSVSPPPAPAPQPRRTMSQPTPAPPRGRQPAGAGNASLATASVSAPAPAAAPRGRKRKAPTDPPPPSRPFKLQQYVSPFRIPVQVRLVAKAEEFHRMIGLPKKMRTNYCDTLPRLRRPSS